MDDPRSIRFLRGEHFTDLPGGKRRQVDLLAQVPVRKGSEKLVLVHVEIERRAHAAMGERLAQYATALQMRHGRSVVPIVLFLKGGQAGVRRRIHTLVVSKAKSKDSGSWLGA